MRSEDARRAERKKEKRKKDDENDCLVVAIVAERATGAALSRTSRCIADRGRMQEAWRLATSWKERA